MIQPMSQAFINYPDWGGKILIDTDESDHRLEPLHENVKKYGTVFNTVAPGTALNGILRRAC